MFYTLPFFIYLLMGFYYFSFIFFIFGYFSKWELFLPLPFLRKMPFYFFYFDVIYLNVTLLICLFMYIMKFKDLHKQKNIFKKSVAWFMVTTFFFSMLFCLVKHFLIVYFSAYHLWYPTVGFPEMMELMNDMFLDLFFSKYGGRALSGCFESLYSFMLRFSLVYILLIYFSYKVDDFKQWVDSDAFWYYVIFYVFSLFFFSFIFSLFFIFSPY